MKRTRYIMQVITSRAVGRTRTVAALVAMVATIGAATASRDAYPPPRGTTPTGSMRVVLRGAQQGPLFLTSCGATSAGDIAVNEFTDLTDPNAPAGVSTFELKFPLACVAPVLTALYHHEPLSGAIGFFSVDGTPTLAFSLANAYVAHVGTSINAGSNNVVVLTVDLVSPSWTASVPASNAGSSWANPPGATSSAPSGAPSSGSSSTVAKGTPTGSRAVTLNPTAVRAAAIAPRKVFGVDFEALRTHRARLGAVVATGGGSSTGGSSGRGSSQGKQAIVSPYITATLVGSQTAFPSPTFQGRDLGFDVRATLGSHGESTGAPTITLLPLHATVTGSTAALLNAAQHHEPMQSTTFVVRSGSSGQPVLTVVPHAPVLTSDHLVTGSNVTFQEMTFSLSGMTVTDATSGRTATSSP